VRGIPPARPYRPPQGPACIPCGRGCHLEPLKTPGRAAGGSERGGGRGSTTRLGGGGFLPPDGVMENRWGGWIGAFVSLTNTDTFSLTTIFLVSHPSDLLCTPSFTGWRSKQRKHRKIRPRKSWVQMRGAGVLPHGGGPGVCGEALEDGAEPLERLAGHGGGLRPLQRRRLHRPRGAGAPGRGGLDPRLIQLRFQSYFRERLGSQTR